MSAERASGEFRNVVPNAWTPCQAHTPRGYAVLFTSIHRGRAERKSKSESGWRGSSSRGRFHPVYGRRAAELQKSGRGVDNPGSAPNTATHHLRHDKHIHHAKRIRCVLTATHKHFVAMTLEIIGVTRAKRRSMSNAMNILSNSALFFAIAARNRR